MSRRTQRKQLRHIHQPGNHTLAFLPGTPLLRMKPIEIGVLAVFVETPHDAAHRTPRHTQQYAGGGEQRHLRVIGNEGQAPFAQRIPRETAIPAMRPDLRPVQKFDGIAECVPDRPADHAAQGTVLIGR